MATTKYIFSIVFFVATATQVFSGIRFSDCALSDNGRVSFIMENDHNGKRTALLTHTSSLDTKILLTADPSELTMVSRDTLQVRSSYGTLWCDLTTAQHKITQKEIFETAEDSALFCPPMTVDRTSTYTVFLARDKVLSATASLLLKDLKTNKTYTLDDGALLNDKSPRAIWCENGILVYEKAGSIYFANPESLFDGTEIDLDYRKITDGAIESVRAIGNDIIYVSGDTVYKVGSKELYTLSLYGGLAGMGRPLGRLERTFNSARDEFFIDNACENIVIKSGNTYSLYRPSRGGLALAKQKTLTNDEYLILGSRVFFVTDTLKTNVFLALSVLPFVNTAGGEPKTYLYIYDITKDFDLALTVEDCTQIFPSPSGAACAIPCGKSLYFYKTSDWKRFDTLTSCRASNATWRNDSSLIIADDNTIFSYSLDKKGEQVFLIPTSAASLSFIDSTNLALETPNKSRYLYNIIGSFWSPSDLKSLPKKVTTSGVYRIFIGETTNSRFDNALYIRDIKSGKSNPVLSESVIKTGEHPKPPKKVALIFDAYDSREGLGEILFALRKHKITATFFLNGEFIKRFPRETRLLSRTQYECASMFFSPAPLVSKSFIADEKFIKQGLGRLEDEYYAATGKEISLLWHAPYYQTTDAIIKAGEAAGYTYMKKTFLTQENIFQTSGSSLSPLVMGKRIVRIYMNAVSSASLSKSVVLPVTIGESTFSSNSPNDYRVTGVYQTVVDNLDILINAIFSQGGQFVNVREVLD